MSTCISVAVTLMPISTALACGVRRGLAPNNSSSILVEVSVVAVSNRQSSEGRVQCFLLGGPVNTSTVDDSGDSSEVVSGLSTAIFLMPRVGVGIGPKGVVVEGVPGGVTPPTLVETVFLARVGVGIGPKGVVVEGVPGGATPPTLVETVFLARVGVGIGPEGGDMEGVRDTARGGATPPTLETVLLPRVGVGSEGGDMEGVRDTARGGATPPTRITTFFRGTGLFFIRVNFGTSLFLLLNT